MSPTTAAQQGRALAALNLNLADFDQPAALESLAAAAISDAEFVADLAEEAPPGHWSSAYTVPRESAPDEFATNTGISSHAQSTVPFLPNSITSSLHAVLSPNSTSAVHGFEALRRSGNGDAPPQAGYMSSALERAEDVEAGVPARIAARGGVVPMPTIHSVPGVPAPFVDESPPRAAEHHTFMVRGGSGLGDPAPDGDEDGDPIPTLPSSEGIPPPPVPGKTGHSAHSSTSGVGTAQEDMGEAATIGAALDVQQASEPTAAEHSSQAGVPPQAATADAPVLADQQSEPLPHADEQHSRRTSQASARSGSAASEGAAEGTTGGGVEPPFGLVDEHGRVAVRDADTGKVYWLGGESPDKATAAPTSSVHTPGGKLSPPTPSPSGGAAAGRASSTPAPRGATAASTDSPQDGKFYQGHSTFVGMHALQRRRSESVSATSRAASARSPPSAAPAAAASDASSAAVPGHKRKRSFFARLFKKKPPVDADASVLPHVPAYAADTGSAADVQRSQRSSITSTRSNRTRSGSGSSGSRSRSRSGSRGRARKKWDVSTTYTQRDIRELTHVRFCQALTDHARDGEHIWCSAFSKDGQFFASAGGTEGAAVVRCWTVQPWTESLRAANELRSKAQIAKAQEEQAKGPRGAPALLAAQRASSAAAASDKGGAATSTAHSTPVKAQPAALTSTAPAASGTGCSSTPQPAPPRPRDDSDTFESPLGGGASSQATSSASPLKATPGSRMKHINVAGGPLSARDTPGTTRPEDPTLHQGGHSRGASMDATAAMAAAARAADLPLATYEAGLDASGEQQTKHEAHKAASANSVDSSPSSADGVRFRSADSDKQLAGVDEVDVGCAGHSITGQLDDSSDEELPPALISGYGPEGTPLPLFESEPVQVWRGHTGFVVDMAWSRANLLVTASMDRFVRLWHPQHTQCIHKFQHPSSVTAVDFHPVADNYFVSGSFDRRVRVWSLETGRVVLWTTVKTMPSSIAFSPDAQQIAVGRSDGVVSLYYTDGLRFRTDIEVRNRRGRLSGGRKVSGIEFSADGAHILISTNDSRLRLLRMDNLRCVMKYAGPTLWHTQIHASFDAAGERVICGSEDTSVFVWRTFHDGYTPMINPVYTGYRYDKNKSYESFSIAGAQPATGAFDLQQVKQNTQADAPATNQRNLCVTSTHFAPVPSVAMARPPSFLLPLQAAGAVVDPAVQTPAFQGLKAAADAETLTETSAAEMTAVAEKAGRPLERCAALFVCCDSDGIIRVYEQLGAAKVI